MSLKRTPIVPRQTFRIPVTAGGAPVHVTLTPRAIPTPATVSGELVVSLSEGSSVPAGAIVRVALDGALKRDDEACTFVTPLAAVTLSATDGTDLPVQSTGGWSSATDLMAACTMTVTPGGISGTAVLVTAVDLVTGNA